MGFGVVRDKIGNNKCNFKKVLVQKVTLLTFFIKLRVLRVWKEKLVHFKSNEDRLYYLLQVGQSHFLCPESFLVILEGNSYC
jgi:hypothetical protein